MRCLTPHASKVEEYSTVARLCGVCTKAISNSTLGHVVIALQQHIT